jgi:hypothetical protein
MGEAEAYPYETRLNIRFRTVELATTLERAVILMVENAGIVPTGN